jgi:hypothetical protein
MKSAMSDHVTVYLADDNARVAHLREDCSALRNRPAALFSAHPKQAVREGEQVSFLKVNSGLGRVVEKRLPLCRRCRS